MKHESIGKVLSMAHRAHHALVDEKLKESGLGVSSGQFFLLLSLYRNDGMYQQELAEYYRIDKAAVARGITKLEELGLVRRLPSPSDQRKSEIRLTEEARSYQSRFMNMMGEIEERIRSYLTEEEIVSFLRIAETIRRGLSEEETNTRAARQQISTRRPAGDTRPKEEHVHGHG